MKEITIAIALEVLYQNYVRTTDEKLWDREAWLGYVQTFLEIQQYRAFNLDLTL